MKITIIAVGRKLSPAMQQICDDYLKRLDAWVDLKVQVLPPSKLSGKKVIDDDSDRILKHIISTDYLIVLDERGIQFTNEQFANRLEKVQEYMKHVVIVIGGAFGVNNELRDRAQLVWSLSSLILPHELVRIIVCEQMYRTYAIMNRHPYHHVSILPD